MANLKDKMAFQFIIKNAPGMAALQG
jgi:hypothetical protein